MALAGLNLTLECSNFLKYLEIVETASPHTIKSYKNDLVQAFPEISEKKAANTGHTEESILAQARKALVLWGPLSPASRNRKASVLKSFFNYLFQEKKINRPLSELIPTTKIPKKLPHYISVDEALSVFKTAKDKELILFLLLYGGGLRISEACSLRWNQIHFPSRTLRIRGKGNKERIIALPATALFEIQKLPQNTDFIWGENALSQRKAYEIIRQLGIKSQLLKPLHPHCLRHSFATHLLTSGANLRTLQELLGHRSLQATEKYTHLGVNELARTLDRHHPFGKDVKNS